MMHYSNVNYPTNHYKHVPIVYLNMFIKGRVNLVYIYGATPKPNNSTNKDGYFQQKSKTLKTLYVHRKCR